MHLAHMHMHLVHLRKVHSNVWSFCRLGVLTCKRSDGANIQNYMFVTNTLQLLYIKVHSSVSVV